MLFCSMSIITNSISGNIGGFQYPISIMFNAVVPNMCIQVRGILHTLKQTRIAGTNASTAIVVVVVLESRLTRATFRAHYAH